MITPTLQQLIDNDDLLEIGRKAIEDALVELRDARMFIVRNNGLVIREKDGAASDVVRMGPESAIRIALLAIKEYCELG